MPASEPDLEIQAAARLLADGNPADAARMLESLVAATPVYAAGLVLLARAYGEEGRLDDALEAWHRAHFLVPTSPLVRRERQRLLDARVLGIDVADSAPAPSAMPPPLPTLEESIETEDDLLAEALLAEAAAAPSDPVFDDSGEAGTDELDEPFDTLWADEPAEDDLLDVQWEEDQPPTEPDAPGLSDAPPPVLDAEDVDASTGAPVMDAFEWSLSPPEDRPPVLPTPDQVDADSPRLFSEEAFAAETTFEAETVFGRTAPLPRDEDPEAGWTLLDETHDPAQTFTGAQEADVAPPLAFDRSLWSVVPTAAESSEAGTPARSPAPGEPDDATSGPPQDDLESLIEQLETAPRIRPDPHFVEPESVEDPQQEDEDVVSETLARIYAAQAQFSEAAVVYDRLAVLRPDRAAEFRRRAEEMRGRAGAQ